MGYAAPQYVFLTLVKCLPIGASIVDAMSTMVLTLLRRVG